MVSTFIGLLDIQSWWEIPCIAHFCSLFSSAFDLPDIDIEDLELALLTDGTEENSSASFLPDLIVSLLKGCNAVRREQITTSNYQMFLRRCLRHFCRENNIENYFDADTDFQSLPLRNKLLVLYCLCHLRLESKDVPRKFNNLEADSLRVEPLGYDSKNSSYWYFYGTRLYREDTKIDTSKEQQECNVLGTTSTSSSSAAVATVTLGNVKENQNNNNKNTIWQVVCFTEEDWQNLTSKFNNSTSEKERALYNILTENFLPKLPELFREKEKLRRRKLLQIRSSARIRNLTEEKQKIAEKEKLKEAEQQQKLEEKLKIEEIRKKPTRTRRRSQSVSTTASGISTYASSLRGSLSSSTTNSSDFLCQREKFCLSPDLVDTTSNSNDVSEGELSEISEKQSFNDEFNNQILEEDLFILDPIGEANEAFRKRRATSIRKSSPSSSSSISKRSDTPPLREHLEENITCQETEVDQENKENHCRPVCLVTETECKTTLKSNLKRKSKSATTAIRLEMAPTTNIKVTGRQTNNSLSSLTGNIFIPDTVGAKSTSSKPTGASSGSANSTSNNTKCSQKPPVTETANIKSKKLKNSESFMENDEVLQIGMHKVLVYVKNHRDAWPFMDPVEEDIAPRYYSIIRRPMDLLKMEEKLDNGEYTKFSEFRNDFKLIVNNCRLYNGQNNEYTEMVNNLQEAFDKATKKYFDQISSEEEGTISYPDSKINNIREKYFNKTNTPKSTQKEISKKAVTTNKDKERRDTNSVENNKDDESKIEEMNLNIEESNKSNKRKRKDKDKRRKKKSKTKHSASSADLMEKEDHKNESDGSVSDDLNEDSEENKDIKDRPGRNDDKDSDSIETDDQVINKLKRKPAGGKKVTETAVVNKKMKKKHNDTVTKEIIKELPKEDEKQKRVEEENTKKKPKNSVKKTILKDDKKHNKHGKVHKNIKNKKSENTNDESKVKGNENKTKNSSEDESTSSPLTATVNEDKAHQKNNSSQEQSSNKTKNKNRSTYDNKKSTNLSKTNNNNNNNSNNNNNNTYNNCNSNSKLVKENQSSLSKIITEPEKTKDRKGKSSSNTSKRKVNKVKKSKKVETNESQGKLNESDDDSLSLSSSPVFKVDLHKKYAKSASSHDEEINENFNNSHSKTKLVNNNSNRNRSATNKPKEDLTSVSSHSVSRSPSPSGYPDKNFVNLKDKKESNSPKLKNEGDSPEEKHESSTEQIPLFMDKYDLIKQRRNRNTEEKWNQIVKDAEKLKSSTRKRPSIKHSNDQSKEKNQKLRETIEKLKEKNAKSKEQSVLIDEIFGVKPAQEIRDEKTIFEKIRETCLDSKSSPSHGKKSNESLKRSHNQENNSSDKCSPLKKTKKRENKQEKNPLSDAGGSPKKLSKKHANNLKKNPSKTNMEALELETEQTLKDINRWLEHTPRFSEFSSASNSPSHYNLLDDFDAVTSKLDPNDFRRPVPITPPKTETVPKLTETLETLTDNTKKDVIPDLIPSVNNSLANETNTLKIASPLVTLQSKNKESTTPSIIQLLPHPPPPPPHIKSQQQKENKRKSLKEKLTGITRRKDVLRTIERLQPGKTKGNLISNMHNVNKPDELFPIGPVAKTKEVKNSLVVETDETAPKLSLGSVLNTEGFGLGQLHNFKDDIASGELKMSENVSLLEEPSEDKKEEMVVVSDTDVKSETSNLKKEEKEIKEEAKTEKSSATPNLSAWFKAFGAPKKTKKLSEEEKKIECIDSMKSSSPTEEKSNGDQLQQQQQSVGNTFNTILKSPQGSSESFPLPAPRQRKASTGSTISERSSFSQDPDSPRIGIDDRFGSYSGPYASPIGASPIMVSPKPEDIGKPTSPYPLNGTIKVGFYQDTTTKSSPEKSCSPRELPSPYPQYSQHIYSTSTSSTTVTTNDGTATFGNCYNPPTEQSKSILYPNTSPSPLYDQYKQPKSQESDYNSSMSPNTNPNSPYQQPKNSPYQQHPNSPYQQAQTSPYQQQPNSPYQQPQNSPYQQPQNSPYQQSQNSPYQQQQTSPYQTSPAGSMQNVLPTQSPTSSPVQQQGQITPQGSIQQQHQSDPIENKTPSYTSQTDNSVVHQQPTNLVYGNQNGTSSYSQESSVLSMPAVRPLHQQQPSQYSIPENSSYQPDTNNSSNLLNNQQPPKWSNPSPSRENEQRSENSQIPTHPIQRQSIITEDDSIANKQKVNTSYPEAQQHYPPPIFNTPFNKTSLTALSPVSFTPDMTKRSSENEQSQLMDLGGYTNQQNSKNLSKSIEEKSCDFTVNKQQQMFDSFLGSMGTNKNHLVGFGKPMDISTSKAFEMFNRAATMGFSKEFPTNLINNAKPGETTNNSPSIQQNTPTGTTCNYSTQPPQQISQSSYPVIAKQLNNNSILNPNQRNKPINMVNSAHSQSAHQQLQTVPAHSQHFPPEQHDTGKLPSYQQEVHSNLTENKHHAHHPNHESSSLYNPKLTSQSQPNPYSTNSDQSASVDKMSHDVPISLSANSNRTAQSYKPSPYNNSTGLLDPLRGLNHPLSTMMDDTIIDMQNTSSSYYGKNIPPAHMFTKNLGHHQQMYQNHLSPYSSRDQQNPLSPPIVPYGGPPPASTGTVPPPVTTNPEIMEPKPTKRTRRKKNTTTPSVVAESMGQQQQLHQQQHHHQQQLNPNSNNSNILSSQTSTGVAISGSASQVVDLQSPSQLHQNSHSHHIQNQAANHQGFQLYAGIKTATVSAGNSSTVTPSPTAVDSSTAAAISLKTNMVPGSAFNFGPSPTAPLGLSTGIYPENSNYLDEYRGAPNPYYIPPSGHSRTGSDGKVETQVNAGGPPAPSTPPYHQFLTHTPARGSYPFMNSPQLDPSSPIYQQYLQRQDELRARMMLNQGLLGAPGGPTGYPQPSYRPALGMPKPYDMNRQPWF